MAQLLLISVLSAKSSRSLGPLMGSFAGGITKVDTNDRGSDHRF